jgi:catalase
MAFILTTAARGAASAFTLSAVLLLGTAAAQAADAAPAPSTKSVPEQTVDTLEKLSGGPHAGYRANHAKGIVVTGTFTAVPGARALSTAAHLQGKTVPVTVRFSDTTGVPNLPDANPNASPHGIAIRFQLPDDQFTDIVSISYDGFPVSTPEDFLAFLNAVAASPADAPKPTAIETFLGSHPAAKAFATDPKPAPVSFATLPFYGVNSFKFTNAKGVSQYVRYRIVPVAGDHRLSAAEAEKAAPNYLMDELPTRLAKAPVKFKLIVQLAKDGDAINDGSIAWSRDHKEVLLGTLSLTKALPDSAAAEKKLFFSPTNLVDGIAPSADPVLLSRPVAYAFSVARRTKN